MVATLFGSELAAQVAPSLVGNAVSAIGGLFDNSASSSKRWTNHWNTVAMDWQREMAETGIQKRVADAKAAGLHPLAAIGANINSSSPAFNVGVSSGSTTGQDLGRAVSAGLDVYARKDQQALAQTLQQEQLEGIKLDNEGRFIDNQIKASQLAKLQQPGTGNVPTPGLFIEGQGNAPTGLVAPKASEVVVGSRNSAGRQPGQITEYQFTAPDSSGSVGLVPSEDMKNRMDDDFIASTLWHLQNRLVAPRHPNKDLYWNPLVQRYVDNPIRRFRRYLKGGN